ncbi:MAG: DUF3336 domain-containing protein [Pseudomonadota bacterium]
MIIGINNKARRLERDLRHAQTYSEWKGIARELDRLDGLDDWRADDRCGDYNFLLIRNRLRKLRALRAKGDIRELVFWLHEGLHGNIGNIANPALYGIARYNTKELISDYINELCATLTYLAKHDFDDFPLGEKVKFFKRLGIVYGRSALMLSGGATMGMWHIGVVKAMHEEGVLPRVMSGSSAGSIIGGVVGTTPTEDLINFYDPEYIYTHAFQALGVKEALRQRTLMDGNRLQDCLQENIGEMTFEEAFEHTGRILNITVSPVEQNQQPRLLNYLTAPNVLVRQAALASCSIPGVFPPVTLLAKDYHGRIVPYLPSMKWADGSLKSDLPRLRLSRYFDVNHYIVSQTNPHVVPFMQFQNVVDRSGLNTPVTRFAANTARVNTEHLLNTAQQNMKNKGMGRAIGGLHTMMKQNYRGDITLIPRFRLQSYARILSNPSPAEIADYMLAAERQTWPNIERIRNATMVSATLDECIKQVKAQSRQQRQRLRAV